jgi:hypothetical protein
MCVTALTHYNPGDISRFMSTTTLIIIIVVVLLLFGGGYGFSRRGR